MKHESAKRRYDSTRRQARARETRERILEAARRLFTTRGYAGTTMEALAQEADVAVETVYASFQSKRTVLARLIDRQVLGDDAPEPILERAAPQRVRLEPDQRRQIALFAADMTGIMERVGPLFGVLRAAAVTEPNIAELLQGLLATRRANLIQFAGWVAEHGPLRAGLTVEDAGTAAWALSSAEMHHLLTVDAGWSPERFAAWLGDTLIATLLPPEPGA
jgi:AcrR family transcriptional regulator